MIVRTLEECRKTDRRVVAENGNWESVRLSLKDDGMGFSFHITTIYAGTETHICYKNHLETVYCMPAACRTCRAAGGRRACRGCKRCPA